MIVLYTAILGTCDSLKPAPTGADLCVCFTDDPSHLNDPQGWSITLWPQHTDNEWRRMLWQESDPRREAWRLRCIPHELFTEYATSIWVDASFTVTNLPLLLRDAKGHNLSGLTHMKRQTYFQEGAEIIRVGQASAQHVQPQLTAYRREGFKPSALTISCILVRANTPKVKAFNETWLQEIRQHPGDNTQISIDYAAWKVGLAWHPLTGGHKGNPYAVYDSADHKKRRQPYRQVVNQ